MQDEQTILLRVIINAEKVSSHTAMVTAEQLFHHAFLFVQHGKKHKLVGLVQQLSEAEKNLLRQAAQELQTAAESEAPFEVPEAWQPLIEKGYLQEQKSGWQPSPQGQLLLDRVLS